MLLLFPEHLLCSNRVADAATLDLNMVQTEKGSPKSWLTPKRLGPWLSFLQVGIGYLSDQLLFFYSSHILTFFSAPWGFFYFMSVVWFQKPLFPKSGRKRMGEMTCE